MRQRSKLSYFKPLNLEWLGAVRDAMTRIGDGVDWVPRTPQSERAQRNFENTYG